MKVLVVEDDRDLRATLVDILEGQGYGVAGVSCADDAIEVLEADPPGLVILDLLPPHLLERSGMRALCARLGTAGTPAIAITSIMAAERDLPVSCTVLRKPFGLDALLGAVRAHALVISRSGSEAR